MSHKTTSLASWVTGLLYGLAAILAFTAVKRLGFTFPHLIFDEPLDLGSRYLAVQQWFSGNSLYHVHSSTYPPASYLILWPFLGWLPLKTVCWLWAGGYVLALAWLLWCCLKLESIAAPAPRCLLATFLLAMTSTSVAIWLGQLVPFLLVFLSLAMLMIHPPDGKVGWKRESAATVLMLLAMVKPSVTAPFLWLLLWSPARPRAAMAVVFGYGALTFMALWFQKDGLQEMAGWAETINRNGDQLSEGYANLRVWLAALGLKAWSHPASLGVWLWLGWWTRAHRRADQWLRFGVTALVARLWTYHNSYDDMLLILPLMSLFQIAAQTSMLCRPKEIQSGLRQRIVAQFSSASVQARLLAGVWILLLLLLPSWLFKAAWWGMAARGLTGFLLVATLAFLLHFVRQQSQPSMNQARG